VYDALCALESIDSVTVDPHKLGFVPYPAGAITMRDRRARDLVAVEAPYVFHRGASEWGYIGRYIFEGSKPGAAAAGVWMSHKVLPLDSEGYGHLIGQTAKGARRLHRRLGSGEWGGFRVVLLPPPDLNIVCFTVGHPRHESLDETNQFVDRLYMALRIDEEPGSPIPDYLVTKTILRAGEYGNAAAPLVESLGFEMADYRSAGGLSVIRCTVMDPFLVEPRGRRDHIEEFASTLLRTMSEVLELSV
jgi:glutamate/tyrosine decarboxylase-like PLP-dependent enzyme